MQAFQLPAAHRTGRNCQALTPLPHRPPLPDNPLRAASSPLPVFARCPSQQARGQFRDLPVHRQFTDPVLQLDDPCLLLAVPFLLLEHRGRAGQEVCFPVAYHLRCHLLLEADLRPRPLAALHLQHRLALEFRCELPGASRRSSSSGQRLFQLLMCITFGLTTSTIPSALELGRFTRCQALAQKGIAHSK
jgi:hypothetical protein